LRVIKKKRRRGWNLDVVVLVEKDVGGLEVA